MIEDQIIGIIGSGQTPQTGGKFVTRTPHARVVRQEANPVHDCVYELVGGVHATMLGDIEPDGV
jgi:hypothetical protein